MSSRTIYVVSCCAALLVGLALKPTAAHFMLTASCVYLAYLSHGLDLEDEQ